MIAKSPNCLRSSAAFAIQPLHPKDFLIDVGSGQQRTRFLAEGFNFRLQTAHPGFAFGNDGVEGVDIGFNSRQVGGEEAFADLPAGFKASFRSAKSCSSSGYHSSTRTTRVFAGLTGSASDLVVMCLVMRRRISPKAAVTSSSVRCSLTVSRSMS